MSPDTVKKIPAAAMTVRSFLVAALALALAACANHGKVRDQELERISDWLPGRYRSAAAQFTMVPVFAPFIGDHVLYVEHTDAADGHILSQRIYRFEKSADEKAVVHRIFTPKEPQRWASGQIRADIFRGIVLDDLTASPACDLVWTFDGEWFHGAAGRKGCSVRRMAFDGLDLRMEGSGERAGEEVSFRRIDAE